MSLKKITLPNSSIKWEVRVYQSGRGSKRIKRRFDKKIEAEAFLQEYKNQQKGLFQEHSIGIFSSDRTFKDEAEYWFDSAKFKFSAGHLKRMIGAYNQILPEYGHMKIDKMTPEFITRFQKEERERGLEHSTINRKVQIFTSILNHSVKHRRIPFNPCNGYTKLKESPNEMLYWDKSEAISFLKRMDLDYPINSPDRWIYIVYCLALNTALRAGEIWGLQPTDLAEDGLKIFVRRQFNRVSKSYGPTKGNKIRVVPCNSELLSELKKHIQQNQIKLTEPLFMNANRKPICHDNFAKRNFMVDVERWSKDTNLKAIRFHDLRHTATTLMISAGVDIKTVKEICGHSDIQTTMNYVHMVAGSVENVAKTFSISFEKEVS
ncbi:MAG: tyrosine-type recombinase/integrase [Pseudobdellovibrio sp.]